MFEIAATIDGGGMDKGIICCFDPSVVRWRLREAFPDARLDPKDYAWKDFEHFSSVNDQSGAIDVAERDALRRGPIFRFSLPRENGPLVHGIVERYIVHIDSDEPFPPSIRAGFLAFLEQLRFAPCVKIKCIRFEGGREIPV